MQNHLILSSFSIITITGIKICCPLLHSHPPIMLPHPLHPFPSEPVNFKVNSKVTKIIKITENRPLSPYFPSYFNFITYSSKKEDSCSWTVIFTAFARVKASFTYTGGC